MRTHKNKFTVGLTSVTWSWSNSGISGTMTAVDSKTDVTADITFTDIVYDGLGFVNGGTVDVEYDPYSATVEYDADSGAAGSVYEGSGQTAIATIAITKAGTRTMTYNEKEYTIGAGM